MVVGRKIRDRNPHASAPAAVPLSLVIAPAIVDTVNAVLEVCPEVQPRGKKCGAPIRRDAGLLAEHIVAIMANPPEGLDLHMLVESWVAYLASNPGTVKAPQYFFGPKNDKDPFAAHWLTWAIQVSRRRTAAPVATGPPALTA